MSSAPPSPLPTSHFFHSQRLRLHYFEWGAKDAPVLLLVHGGYDLAHSWDDVAREFARDHRVIVPDLRGHGDSDWSPDGSYEMWDFVYDLAELIHQLGVDKLSIIGHSLGGAISTRYVGIYPEKVERFISIEGIGQPPHEVEARAAKPSFTRWREWIEARRTIAARANRQFQSIDEAFERLKASPSHVTDERSRYLAERGVRLNDDGSYGWKYDTLFRQEPPFGETPEEMRALWGNIACPVLLCQGRNTMMSDPSKDGRLAYFPDARMAYFDDAGHWPHYDRFDEFIDVARAFLKI